MYTNKHLINQFLFVSTLSCDLIKLIHSMHPPTQVMQVHLNANNSYGNIGIFSTYTNSIPCWLPLATLLISAYLWFFLVVFVKDQFRPSKFLLANSLYPYMALSQSLVGFWAGCVDEASNFVIPCISKD